MRSLSEGVEGGRGPTASLGVKDNESDLFESQPFPGLLSGSWEEACPPSLSYQRV